jgi:hypothetical protein
MKFLFPTFWIGLFGAGTAMLWIGGFDGAKAPPPLEMKWVFLLAWIAGSTMMWFLCARNKRVEIDDSFIYVSNYVREISVPLDQIETVSENRWMNPRQVAIRFHSDTGFGQTIQFIPKTRFFGFWSSHPVVAELRGLAGMPEITPPPSPEISGWTARIPGISNLRTVLVSMYSTSPRKLLIANLVIALLIGASNGLGVMLGHGMPGLTAEMEAAIVMFVLPGTAAVILTGLIGLIFNSSRQWVLSIHAIVLGIGAATLWVWALELVLTGLPEGSFSWTPGFLEVAAGYAALLICRFNLPEKLRENGRIYYTPIVVALLAVPIDIGIFVRFVEKMQKMMNFT